MSTSPLLRPLGFGEVLDSAFTLYRRRFGSFVAAALVPTLAILAASWVTGFSAGADPATMGGGSMLVFFLAAGAGTLVMWGALTHLASSAYGGVQASAGDGLRVAASRFFALLGASILVGLILMAAFIGIGLVFVVLMAIAIPAMGAGGDPGVMLAGLFGVAVVLLMVVLYALAAAFFFAVFPAVVVEGKGPAAAIGRSVELARGALGRLVGLVVVCGMIVYLPILGVVVLTGTFSTLYDPTAAQAAYGSTAFVLQQVLTWMAGALTTPFFVAALVVQYYDRRVRTEALDVQAAADRLAFA